MNNTSIDIYIYIQICKTHSMLYCSLLHYLPFYEEDELKSHDFNAGSNASCRFGNVFYDRRIVGIDKK